MIDWQHKNGLVLILLILLGTTAGCVVLPNQPTLEQEREARQLIDQGVVYLRQADLKRAQASFEVALELSSLAEALDGLGCVAFLGGNTLDAENYFIRAYRTNPNYLQSLANLALLYESQGLYDQAEKLYGRVLEEDPANFRARNNFAGLMALQKKDKGAIERAVAELRRGEAISNHPLITSNIIRMSYHTDKYQMDDAQ